MRPMGLVGMHEGGGKNRAGSAHRLIENMEPEKSKPRKSVRDTITTLPQSRSRAAKRLIAELRCKVQEHIGRLPVAYYDANKAGSLVSRIMSDVEGVRNLIGTGLV